jgi:hypothetical protein
MKYLPWFLLLAILGYIGISLNLPPQAGEDNNQKDQILVEAATPQTSITLKDLGPAPELTNEVWINSDEPLRLADLRGKVVLLDMWTFG